MGRLLVLLPCLANDPRRTVALALALAGSSCYFPLFFSHGRKDTIRTLERGCNAHPYDITHARLAGLGGCLPSRWPPLNCFCGMCCCGAPPPRSIGDGRPLSPPAAPGAPAAFSSASACQLGLALKSAHIGHRPSLLAASGGTLVTTGLHGYFNVLGWPGGHRELCGPALGRQPHHERSPWRALGGRCHTGHPLPRTTPGLQPHQLPVSGSRPRQAQVAGAALAPPGRRLRKQHRLGEGVCSRRNAR